MVLATSAPRYICTHRWVITRSDVLSSNKVDKLAPLSQFSVTDIGTFIYLGQVLVKSAKVVFPSKRL